MGFTAQYAPLQKYLRDRYADRIVLTFSEIEDLLGFVLPDIAQAQREWWGSDEPGEPATAQSDAWRLAGRTATVNLPARIVIFERRTP